MTDKRVTSIDWLPIELVHRDLTLGSGQIVLLYRKHQHDECYLEYITSNPDYALLNAAKHGFTEFAVLVDC